MFNNLLKMEKMSEKLAMAFLGLAIIFFISGVITGVVREISLDKNFEYTQAIIYKPMTSSKGGTSYHYKFIVDGKEYKGRGRFFKNMAEYLVGDTIDIVYDRTYPKKSYPEQQYFSKYRYF